MKCLFNSMSNNVVGYCKYHHCGVTENQMECKNCHGKQCYHFVKNERNNYWKKAAQKKALRKKRKQAINDYVNRFHGVEAV